MEIDRIRELIDMMKDNDLSEIEIVDGQTRIALKRGGGQVAPAVTTVGAAPVAAGASAGAEAAPTAEASNAVEIPSPIVGTFYAAPSPNAEAFVTPGTHVDEETVVCIVEAMKVMNEIKAGVSGTIRKALVANGSAVEYGQGLFAVEPD